MIKLLITGLLVYFIYRTLSKSGRINSAHDQRNAPLDGDFDDEDYIDYEEVK